MTRWTKGRVLTLAALLSASLLLFGCGGGSDGAMGETGLQGMQGMQGPPGEKGDQGRAPALTARRLKRLPPHCWRMKTRLPC